MRQALIGIDVGTTNTKVVAFATDGVELAKALVPTATRRPQPGWVDYDADGLWKTVCALVRQVVDALPHDVHPAAISVTGMAEAGVPLDADGKPLYRAISWLDQRTSGELASWQASVGAERTADITGLPMSTASGILRLLWLRSNEPDVFAQTRSWLNLPDFCAFKLSSAKVTDYSLASRMMTLDLQRKQWSDDLLQDIGITRSLLGELVQSGTQIGVVTEQASAETGLPSGLPVCAAGHDHLCAALGLGVTQPGDVFDSMGTAEAIVVTLDAPRPSAGIASQGIAQGVHVVPDRYYAISGLYYSGGSIDWVRQILTSTLEHDLSSDDVYDQLIAQASKVRAGCDGVHFLPHLRQANAPIFDPLSRAAFVGMTSDAGPGHLTRAVMEGLAYEFQRLVDCVCEAFDINSHRWTASGGGTRNALLMDIKAAVAGKAITVPKVDEATCLGAAVLAGIGAGVYRDVDEAQASVHFDARTIESSADLRRVYCRNYQQVFLKLYASLQQISHTISKLDNDEV